MSKSLTLFLLTSVGALALCRWGADVHLWVPLAAGGGLLMVIAAQPPARVWRRLPWLAVLLALALPWTTSVDLFLRHLLLPIGLAAGLLLLWEDSTGPSVEGARWRWGAFGALLLPAAALGVQLRAVPTGADFPVTIDQTLLALDRVLYLNWSGPAMALFERSPWTRVFGQLAYSLLPVWVALVYAVHLRPGAEPPFRLTVATIAAGVVGPVGYWLWPATGPRWVADLNAPRNAMPSLHTAWIMLAWWDGHRAPRWVAWTLTGATALTLLATLGLGEHYVVDLIAAIPLAAGAWWLAGLVQRRLRGVTHA